VPLESGGKLLTAVVVPLEGANLKRIVFMKESELPRTATGKIRKVDLVDLLAARL
jgi:acyl-coenzyme A synthetase/AMP-(fatty) acid ligase